MTESTCCGQGPAQACRCHTDAEAIAAAIGSFVRRRVANPRDAEDITQETLLRLYRGVSSLRDAAALDGWMYTIARSVIIDHYRRSNTRPAPVEPAVASDRAVAVEDEEITADEVLAACLPPLLQRVPPTYRQALELTDMGGMTQDEAARQLGLSTSGMKSRVQRGRRLLRAEVKRCCEISLDNRGAVADLTLRDPERGC